MTHSDDFKTNAAGFKVSHVFGFGLLDALDLVMAAKEWKQVPTKHLLIKESPEVLFRKPTNPTSGCNERSVGFIRYPCHPQCGNAGCCGPRADQEQSLDQIYVT